MMRRWLTSIVLTAVIAVAVAVAIAGCGSQKRTIPTKEGQSLLEQLDKVGPQYDNGSCNGAKAKAAVLEAKMRQLPRSVDPTVRANLIAGAHRLTVLVAACQPAQTNTTPTTAPTVPTVTNTVPTATIPPPTNTVPSTPTTVPSIPNTTPNTTPTTPGGGGGVSVPGSGVGGTG